jgi:acyl CoA:acetate/3-ketoacid CoA transferase
VDWPAPIGETADTVSFDLDGATALLEFQITAEGNTGIAEAHAAQIVQLQVALAGLLEAGMAQRRVSDLRLEILQEERRQHTIEKVGLYALLIAALGIAAL